MEKLKTDFLKNKTLLNSVAAIVIFLLTFPKFSPFFEPGLDHSYIWALNWLFQNDYSQLTDLVYPLGPLAFLKHPLAMGANLGFAIAFYSIVKLGFITLFLYAGSRQKTKSFVLVFLLCLIVSYFANLDFLIIALSTLSLMLFLEKDDKWFLLPSAILFPIGFFIKSSIGFAVFPILAIALILNFLKNRNLYKSLYYFVIYLLFYLLIGLLCFSDFSSFLKYNTGIFRIVTGYSSALSLYSDNNWFLLGLFVLSIFSIPIFFREKSVRYLFILQIFTLFAMWKHALSREDFSHYGILIGYMVVFWSLIILFSKTKSNWLYILPAISILLLVANMKNLEDYRPYSKEIVGINNFNEAVVNYSSFVKEAEDISKTRIEMHRLDKQMLEIIGTSTIDVYPNELSYVAANNFNWQPRKTLQSGGLSGWLDWKSSCNFTDSNAVDFVLLHYTEDIYGGLMGTIDGRYLLNDEPKTLFSIFNHYDVVRQNNEVLLFKKNKKDKFLETKESEKSHFPVGKWLVVPSAKQSLLRAKIDLQHTFFGSLKSFLFKDEAAFIDYKMSNGEIRSYRFVTANASDGLWISPLSNGPVLDGRSVIVDSIRIRTSNNKLYHKDFDLCWLKNRLNSENASADMSDFLSNSLFKNDLFFSVTEDFENPKSKFGGSFVKDTLNFHSGNSSCVLKSGAFSPAFEIIMDTLWNESLAGLIVEATVSWNSFDGYANASLIISMDDSEDDFWRNVELKGKPLQWEIDNVKTRIDISRHKKGRLKIYVWNAGNSVINIDDFSIVFREI